VGPAELISRVHVYRSDYLSLSLVLPEAASLAKPLPAGELVRALMDETERRLAGSSAHS
jgi:hypothetical protein